MAADRPELSEEEEGVEDLEGRRWSMATAPSSFAEEEDDAISACTPGATACATAATTGKLPTAAHVPAVALVPTRPPPPPKLRFPPELRGDALGSFAIDAGGTIAPAVPVRCTRRRTVRMQCASLWAYLRACWAWCAYETHAMLFHWSCPASFSAMPMDAQLRHWSVRYNPIYWLMFAMTMPFLLVGVIFHDSIGQGPSHFEPATAGTHACAHAHHHHAGAGAAGEGGRAAPASAHPSPHEQQPPPPGGQPGGAEDGGQPRSLRVAEKHIRVHWLYMTDAFYALELVVGFVLLIGVAARPGRGTQSWSHELTNLVASDIVLPCCMIGGNVFFLSAIKRKRHWTTRYFILVNGCYALSKVVSFCYYIAVILRLPHPLRYLPVLLGYCGETAMFVLAVYIYSALWSGYQDFEFEAALAAVEQAAADADRQAAAKARRSSRLAAAAAAAGAASLAAVSSRSWRLGSISVAGAAPFRDLRSPLASPLGRGTAGGSHGGGPLGGGMEDSVCGSSGRCSVGDLEQSCRSAASMESQRRLLKRQGSSMVIVPGFGVLRRAIEGLTDRIEQQQATASRVSLNLPCMGGKDEWPIFTLVLMALTCALIWGMMLTTIHLHIGALGEVDHGEDGGGRR